MTKSERSSYTPLDFQEWSETKILEISPKFQRRGVWSRAAKSYLIDTMLLGMPVPPIYLRVVQDKSRKRMIREVIDGQQRISAILDFLNGKYSLGKNIKSTCVGRHFDDLSKAQKDSITQYPFICEVFYGIEDSEVLEIFARLNTHSVKLNAQELRNGNYFGIFKRSAYDLSYEHLEFWRTNRIFTEMGIARMLEAELTSELMILQIDGLQDKKKSISNFYERFDEEFADCEKVEVRFRTVIDAITDACAEFLSSTEFRRVPLFYSLYSAVHHRLFGVPRVQLETPRSGRLPKADSENLANAVAALSDYVMRAKHEEEFPERYEAFVTACLRQTDNIRPRSVRLETIYNTAFA